MSHRLYPRAEFEQFLIVTRRRCTRAVLKPNYPAASATFYHVRFIHCFFSPVFSVSVRHDVHTDGPIDRNGHCGAEIRVVASCAYNLLVARDFYDDRMSARTRSVFRFTQSGRSSPETPCRTSSRARGRFPDAARTPTSDTARGTVVGGDVCASRRHVPRLPPTSPHNLIRRRVARPLSLSL